MDFINSIEFHRENAVEADLFYRFFNSQYTQQDLTFFIFIRGLTEQELRVKINGMPQNFDIRTWMIHIRNAQKISFMYFDSLMGGEHSKNTIQNLAVQFTNQLVQGAKAA